VTDNQSAEVVTIQLHSSDPDEDGLELDEDRYDVGAHTAYALPFSVEMNGDRPEAYDAFFATEDEYRELLEHCDGRYARRLVVFLFFSLTVHDRDQQHLGITDSTFDHDTWIEEFFVMV
jgi:hypothetical protein